MLGQRLLHSECRAAEEISGTAESAEALQETLGQRLRARRESLQLEIQAVCEILHVRCAVIEALEADDFERAGTPLVYLRGYARNYVRMLNPASEALDAWLDEVAMIGAVTSAVPRRRAVRVSGGSKIRPWFNPRWLPWSAVLLVVVLLLVWLRPETDDRSEQADRPPVPAAGVVAETAAMLSPSEARQTDATVAPVGADPAAATTQDSVALRGRLRLEFTDRSWTQVEDGLGRVLEKRTVEAGSTTRYEGVLPFRVTLGNAVYVRVYFNDEEYDHLNDITDDNIARIRLGGEETRP